MLFHTIMNFFYHFIYSNSSINAYIKVYLNASLFSKRLEEKYFYKWSKVDYS